MERLIGSKRKSIDLEKGIKFNQSRIREISFDEYTKYELLSKKDQKYLQSLKIKLQNFEDIQSVLQNVQKLANRHLFDLQYTDKWDDFSIEILLKEDIGKRI